MRQLMKSVLAEHSERNRRGRRWLQIASGLTVLWAILPNVFGHRVVVINTSPSVQTGIYIRLNAAPKVGSLIDFEIPAAARPYIFARSGNTGEGWYILKPILAGPGDRVDTTGGWLIVNNKRIAPMPPRHDTANRALPVWRCCRRLAGDEFFVFSNRIPNSFDSRCYGPIRKRNIFAVRSALIAW